MISGDIVVEHHSKKVPIAGTKCVVCTDDLSLPYFTFTLPKGEKWLADESCWRQLNGMADTAVERHVKKGLAMN